MTLMRGAVACGSTTIINMMLEEGVDVNIQDRVSFYDVISYKDGCHI